MRASYASEAELFAEQGGAGVPRPGPFDGSRIPHRRRCAFAVYGSGNGKLKGLCSTTYASQWSCPRPGDGVSPRPCPLYRNGCYGEYDYVDNVMKLVKPQACTPVEVAMDEAEAIRDLYERHQCPLPIRLHTIGDCSSETPAAIVADVCNWYMRQSGAPVYNYTHAWNVPRKTWGRVSVLQSCQTAEECVEALHRDYAPAMLVQQYERRGPYPLAHGLTGIPCPSIAHEAQDITCAFCGKCWHDGTLRSKRHVILFTPHGKGKNRAATVACRDACTVR